MVNCAIEVGSSGSASRKHLYTVLHYCRNVCGQKIGSKPIEVIIYVFAC